jgi:hypothetical protein
MSSTTISGQSGSVLHEYSDWYFAEHETDWGRGFNLDGQHSEPVRAFMRANVRHWIDGISRRRTALRCRSTRSSIARQSTSSTN